MRTRSPDVLSAPDRQRASYARRLARYRPYNALALRGGNDFQKHTRAAAGLASVPGRARYAAGEVTAPPRGRHLGVGRRWNGRWVVRRTPAGIYHRSTRCLLVVSVLRQANSHAGCWECQIVVISTAIVLSYYAISVLSGRFHSHRWSTTCARPIKRLASRFFGQQPSGSGGGAIAFPVFLCNYKDRPSYSHFTDYLDHRFRRQNYISLS